MEISIMNMLQILGSALEVLIPKLQFWVYKFFLPTLKIDLYYQDHSHMNFSKEHTLSLIATAYQI